MKNCSSVTLSGCTWVNPPKVNHFALFDAIPNARWKGCVEARPAPYDVTDDPPGAAANTKFVPYFWMDDDDDAKNINNYLPDAAAPPGAIDYGDWSRVYDASKYDGDAAVIDETAPTTMGPNKACPNPLLPLTTNKNTVRDMVRGLNFWNDGGTINSEGLMWGWRTLSPGIPFTEGKPYGEARKILVLMSDGLNDVPENPNGAIDSDYSAYNYLRLWNWDVPRDRLPSAHRLPINDGPQFQTYLDQRFALACTNAKAAGIEVYTVLFREEDEITIDLFRACATEPTNFFRAENQEELDLAFEKVGQSIRKLRLTK